MQKCLHDQIGFNVESYVDDVVIKKRNGSDLLKHLAQTFANLRRFQMKPNLDKCLFGVPSGKPWDLLSLSVALRQTQKNQGNLQARSTINHLRGAEVSRLCHNFKLLHFLARRKGSATLPLLKKTDKLFWNSTAQAALDDLKRSLESNPIRVAPGEAEPMLLYIAATHG